MTDFVVDGKPFETPVGAATEAEARTPPAFADAFAAYFHDASVTEPVMRWMERGAYMDTTSGRISRALANAGAAQAGAPPVFEQDLSPLPAKQLSAAEANERYAPQGPDGKPAPIATAPLPEPVAAMIGKAKAAEIEREGVLARFDAAHSWPVTMGTGVAAFMLDPLNLATTFVPGVGEEAITARLGGGWAARAAGRVVGGATAGAASQVPVTGIRYALGQEEASDYALRDAFRDVFFAAAGTAVLHSGMGAVSDALRARGKAGGGVLPPEPAPEANSGPLRAAIEGNEVLGQNAASRQEATQVAVSQILQGRPIDVEPVLVEHDAADHAQAEQAAQDLARLEAEGYQPPPPPEGGARAPTAEELKAQVPGMEVAPAIDQRITARLQAHAERVAREKGLEPMAPEDVDAWHGSPHIFDDFDITKVGTGEGAQIYGHGIYLAEKQAIGEHYRNVLTTTIPGASEGRAKYTIEGEEFPRGRSGHAALDTAGDIEMYLAHRVSQAGGSHSAGEMADFLKGKIDQRIVYWEDQIPKENRSLGSANEDMQALVDFWEKARAAPVDKIKETTGALYKVRIRGSAHARLLDWDKPLAEQPAAVIKAVEDLQKGTPFAAPDNGRDAYKFIGMRTRSQYGYAEGTGGENKAAAQYLRERGVAGVKYLDHDSRAAGEGTRNFVVFDPQDLRIIERNGITPDSVASRERAAAEAPTAPGIPNAEMERLEEQVYNAPEKPKEPEQAPEQDMKAVKEQQQKVETAHRALALAREDADLIRLAGQCA